MFKKLTKILIIFSIIIICLVLLIQLSAIWEEYPLQNCVFKSPVNGDRMLTFTPFKLNLPSCLVVYNNGDYLEIRNDCDYSVNINDFKLLEYENKTYGFIPYLNDEGNRVLTPVYTRPYFFKRTYRSYDELNTTPIINSTNFHRFEGNTSIYRVDVETPKKNGTIYFAQIKICNRSIIKYG